MTLKARPLGDEWGCDLSTKLSPLTARAIAAATIDGHPVTHVWRYVAFHQPFQQDLETQETADILDAGLGLIVVQHPRLPPWTASGQLGDSDGQWAVRNAVQAGYQAGLDATLLLDLEGLKNSGQDVLDHCIAWCKAVAAGGYHPAIYVGFDCGLNPSELYSIPNVDRYTSDLGHRKVAVRGVCSLQGPTSVICGVEVDSQHAFADQLGGTLTALVRGAAEVA